MLLLNHSELFQNINFVRTAKLCIHVVLVNIRNIYVKYTYCVLKTLYVSPSSYIKNQLKINWLYIQVVIFSK